MDVTDFVPFTEYMLTFNATGCSNLMAAINELSARKTVAIEIRLTLSNLGNPLFALAN